MASNFENIRFSARDIKLALRVLEANLGIAGVETLVYDLENYGLPLVNDRQLYSLAEIQTAFDRVLGHHANPLFFAIVKKYLLEKAHKRVAAVS